MISDFVAKAFGFHCGIHPPQNKHQSTQPAIAQALLASVLSVPIQQHMAECTMIGDFYG